MRKEIMNLSKENKNFACFWQLMKGLLNEIKIRGRNNKRNEKKDDKIEERKDQKKMRRLSFPCFFVPLKRVIAVTKKYKTN